MDDVIKKHLSDILTAIEEVENFLGVVPGCLMIFSITCVYGVLLKEILKL